MLRRLWLNSQTVLLAKVQGSGAIALGVLDAANHTFKSQEFTGLLSTLTVPHWVPIAMAVLAFVTYLAHGHGAEC